MKSNITIRMGANGFTASVRSNGTVRIFDIAKMTKQQEHNFRRELVMAYRKAREN